MFAYCNNNPICRIDSSGLFWKEIGSFFTGVWNGVTTFVSNMFGASASVSTTVNKAETEIIPSPSPITLVTGNVTEETITEIGDSTKPISVYANQDADDYMLSSAGLNVSVLNSSVNANLSLDDISLSASILNNNKTDTFAVKVNLANLKIGFEVSTTYQQGAWANTTYTNCSVDAWAIIALYVLATTGEYMQVPAYSN